ncbi:hypothetical protein ACTIVE_6429 [Actinomadura verrucosospora]|uniref:Uncharacterized protein n=1 Tax=Actinomadura verrucosospora TaxID=46165 RepID=A0A7D3VW70_ACTVE|nr:hypothetical protein ACTIVE_6429 [Actinomadura verrucosospora]
MQGHRPAPTPRGTGTPRTAGTPRGTTTTGDAARYRGAHAAPDLALPGHSAVPGNRAVPTPRGTGTPRTAGTPRRTATTGTQRGAERHAAPNRAAQDAARCQSAAWRQGVGLACWDARGRDEARYRGPRPGRWDGARWWDDVGGVGCGVLGVWAKPWGRGGGVDF